MNPLEPSTSTGRHVPEIVAVFLAIILALAIAFAWPL